MPLGTLFENGNGFVGFFLFEQQDECDHREGYCGWLESYAALLGKLSIVRHNARCILDGTGRRRLVPVEGEREPVVQARKTDGSVILLVEYVQLGTEIRRGRSLERLVEGRRGRFRAVRRFAV
jgi:hypothetical protein